MAILDFNLDEVPELKAVAPGEYSVSILSADERTDKNGNPGIRMVMKISGEEDVKPLSYWLSLPGDKEEGEDRNRKLRTLKRFLECFGLILPLEVDDLVGEEGWVLLSIETSDDYGDQNRIKRFLIQH